MSASISPVDNDVFTVLRAFLVGILPAGVEVIQGPINRAAQPKSDFVIMTPIGRERLSFNVDTYTDGAILDPPTSQETKNVLTPTKLTIQIDVYGQSGGSAGDNAQLINSLFQDDYGCIHLAPKCQPLYAGDPVQAPFVDGEEQYEVRYTLDLCLQYNPVALVPQQFAGTVVMSGIIEANALVG